MKNLSRLTALLLAVLLLFQTAALANTGVTQEDLNRETWDAWVQEATEAAEAQSNTNVTITEGGEVYDIPTSAPVDTPIYESTEEVALGLVSAGAESEISVILPQYGKVQLSVGESGGQWQVQVGEQWINVAGETGSTFDVTYAKVQSLFQLNGYAKVRYVTADELYVSNIAVIGLSYGSQTLEEETFEEEPVMMSAYSLRTADAGIATAAEEGDAEAKTTYNVVVNYVFENNEIVAEPYTANLAKGSDFSATVTFPVQQGYLAYLGDATEASTSYELNITDIQADVTYTVTYKPTNVDYTVIHYQQNVDNDNYSIALTETKQGLTNSYYSDPKTEALELAKSYDGFYALLYNEEDTIAADGSTVVEIYYDRYYYLMNFNLDGGYGVEPIYARYGAPVSVGTPTKAGYAFDRWSPEVPATVPVNGGTYTAQWKMNNTAKVTVVFWGENANDEKYSYLTTGVVNVKPGTEYTFEDGQTVFLICGEEEHTHGEDCDLACGKDEHTQHTDACLTCEHAHTINCYSVGSYYSYNTKLDTCAKPDGIDVPSADGIVRSGDNYYLYINEVWYCSYYYKLTDIGGSKGWTQTPSISISSSCSHTHSNECYGCEYHEHSEACYSCGKVAHTHTSSCNQTGSGLDSNLWTFVKSDTVTVNPDGSSVINVYYDRTTFTMTFKEEGYNGDTLDTITDKWGADIKTRFETISKANTFFWSASSYGGSPWTSFMDIMPQENRTYYADPQSGSTTLTATYLAENLAGTGYETLYTVSFKGSSSITVTEEEFVSIEGFTFNDSLSTDEGSYYNGAKFYYDRHKYAIEFYSPTELLKKTENVPYESPLSSYNWTPDASQAPAQYEPGSVSFEGWYLNPECTGEKFDFATSTMPAGTNDGDTTLTLYAKWVPITHTVEFYLDKTAYDAGTELSTHPQVTVPHGSKVTPTPAKPTNGSYTFVGWFYMDGDQEKAFDFANMPVNKDLKVYGKWSSNVLKQYFIYYKIQGTDTQIAEPTTGSALAASTKTFDAKGGTDLYADYQEGYFPVVKSHSLTIDIENDANNVYTFWYVQKAAVPYTVHYVTEEQPTDSNLGTIELDGKIYYKVAASVTDDDNRKAVVTETFAQVSGYLPDAYQKRLIVDGADGAENVLVFYYTKDASHAYYKITHYTQNTDGESWTEYASSQAVGDIGKRYTADPLTIDGFTFDENVEETVKSGTLTAAGLELKLYYTRNSYPYQVRYLEQGTGKELAEPKNEKGLYGQVISESAIDIANYTAVAPTSQTLTIRIEESQDEAKLNIITFYYTEQEVTIEYKVVGPDGCGTVDLNDTDTATVAGTKVSESVKVLTGNAVGATAAASSDQYRFLGWYDTEDTLLSRGLNYCPTQPTETVDGVETKKPWVGATYYAKFEENYGALKITKKGLQNDDYVVIDVEVKSGESYQKYTTVTLKKDESVTLRLDAGTEYRVIETSWSWTYKPEAGTETFETGMIDGGKEDTVSFSNVKDDKWLNDEGGTAANVFTTTRTE